MPEHRKQQPGGCVLAWLTALLVASLVTTATAREYTAQFTAKGELLLPKHYRQWLFVGAAVTPNEMNNGRAAFPEFHFVYLDPAGFAAYQKKGLFPDGTVLVMEQVGVGGLNAASGRGYFPGEFAGVAAAVKDARRFPKEPGNWAYFTFTAEDGSLLPEATPQPTAACNSCHQQNADEDWVFTQYYPVLRAARPAR